MTDIRCKECDELNDINSIKCESCKASLYNASEVDECEHDYRFIEEAELKGEIYKLEIVEDENRLLEEIPTESTFCSLKGEDELFANKIVEENGRILNGTSVNHKVVITTETDSAANPLVIGQAENTIPIAQYQCEHCSKSFKRKASLKAHVNRIHIPESTDKCVDSIKSEKVKNTKPRSPTFPEPNDSDYEPPDDDSQCNMRGKQLPNKMKREHKDSSDESDSKNNNSKKKCKMKGSPTQTLLDLKQNIPMLKGHRVYQCTACEKISSNYREHINHIVIHEAPVENLTETLSLKELKEAPSGFLNCKQCEEVFMTKRDYNIHLKIHKAEKVFQCELCEGVLVNRSSYRKHMIKMHQTEPTKEKNKHYICNICNERFPAQILLIDHRKTHLDVIKKIEEMTLIDRGGEKPLYVCKICTKTSKNKFRHEEHLRIHTKEKPFKCEQCGERIATSNAMAHHRRLHENDRPFKCDICDTAYRHKKSLKKHLIIHTGERPFKCRYCEKTYTFNYTRASHERNCHIGDGKTRKRRGRVRQVCESDMLPAGEESVEAQNENS